MPHRTCNMQPATMQPATMQPAACKLQHTTCTSAEPAQCSAVIRQLYSQPLLDHSHNTAHSTSTAQAQRSTAQRSTAQWLCPTRRPHRSCRQCSMRRRQATDPLTCATDVSMQSTRRTAGTAQHSTAAHACGIAACTNMQTYSASLAGHRHLPSGILCSHARATHPPARRTAAGRAGVARSRRRTAARAGDTATGRT